MRSKRTAVPGVCLLVVIIVGCGGRDPNLPELVPVGGTITLDGNPLSGTMVSFIPQGKTRGNGATGYTDEKGRYELADRHGGTGAPVGEYRVVLNKLVMPDGSDFPVDSGVAPMDSPAKEILPAAYSDMHQTTLAATVPEGGHTIDIALKSEP